MTTTETIAAAQAAVRKAETQGRGGEAAYLGLLVNIALRGGEVCLGQIRVLTADLEEGQR